MKRKFFLQKTKLHSRRTIVRREWVVLDDARPGHYEAHSQGRTTQWKKNERIDVFFSIFFIVLQYILKK